MTRKVALWLLMIVAGLAAMVWLLPPREIERHVKSQERVEAPPPSFSPAPNQVWRYTVCGIAGAENCWQVGGTPR
jgi:hypothetical protein